MNIFAKAAGAGLISLLCSVLLKRLRPEYAVFTAAAGGVCVLLIIIPSLRSAADVLASFSSRLGQGEEYMALFAKACAAACVSSLISCECRDTGNAALAQVSEFAGKVCVLMIGLPMIKTVLGAVISMLD